MSIQRIILPSKKAIQAPNNATVPQLTPTNEATIKQSWEPLKRKVYENHRKPLVLPIKEIPITNFSGFETGSIYQCLQSFQDRYSTFYENEILEVIGNRKTGKSKDLEIIFANTQNREKKFWVLLFGETEKAKLLFQKLH